MMERESFDAERLREESEERQRRLAAAAPPVYLSGVRKPEASTHFEVDIGFPGVWRKKTVSQDISEEEFNRLASEFSMKE
jgi:CRISPR/Cas system CSM-associated protein Csm5 (group 7 of RAMP superfamily)